MKKATAYVILSGSEGSAFVCFQQETAECFAPLSMTDTLCQQPTKLELADEAPAPH